MLVRGMYRHTRLIHSSKYLLQQAQEQSSPWTTRSAPPAGFWDSKYNQKKYLEHVFSMLQFSSPEDWYKIKKSDFTGPVGKSFMSYFEGNSPYEAIADIYGTKQNPILPWKFPLIPPVFWDNGNNQRKYMEWLGKTLNYASINDWYQVGTEDFQKNSGTKLLALHNSVQNILEFVFPEHEWLTWKFKKLPPGYWDNINNIREFLNWMATDLKFTSMEDWLRLDIETLKKYGVVRALAKYGNLRKLLTAVYPEHQWDEMKVKPRPKTPTPSVSPPSIPATSPITAPPTHTPSSPTLSSPPSSQSAPAIPSAPSASIPTAPSSVTPPNSEKSLPVDLPAETFVYNWSDSKFSLEEKWDAKQDPTNWLML